MKSMVGVIAGVVSAAALAAPAIGGAPGAMNGSSYTLELRGFVPVICRATVGSPVVQLQPGQTDLGQMREFCNSPSGYQVWLDHAAGLQGAAVVDGQRVPLATGGSTLISQSSTAAARSRSLALELADAASANVSVRVVAL